MARYGLEKLGVAAALVIDHVGFVNFLTLRFENKAFLLKY